MSVWISDEKLLIFASLISPSKMILFEKFVKNTPLRVVFSTLFSVFYLVMKHCVSCLIYYIKDCRIDDGITIISMLK